MVENERRYKQSPSNSSNINKTLFIAKIMSALRILLCVVVAGKKGVPSPREGEESKTHNIRQYIFIMGKLKAHTLRPKVKSDLLTQLEDLRGELHSVSC